MGCLFCTPFFSFSIPLIKSTSSIVSDEEFRSDYVFHTKNDFWCCTEKALLFDSDEFIRNRIIKDFKKYRATPVLGVGFSNDQGQVWDIGLKESYIAEFDTVKYPIRPCLITGISEQDSFPSESIYNRESTPAITDFQNKLESIKHTKLYYQKNSGISHFQFFTQFFIVYHFLFFQVLIILFVQSEIEKFKQLSLFTKSENIFLLRGLDKYLIPEYKIFWASQVHSLFFIFIFIAFLSSFLFFLINTLSNEFNKYLFSYFLISPFFALVLIFSFLLRKTLNFKLFNIDELTKITSYWFLLLNLCFYLILVIGISLADFGDDLNLSLDYQDIALITVICTAFLVFLPMSIFSALYYSPSIKTDRQYNSIYIFVNLIFFYALCFFVMYLIEKSYYTTLFIVLLSIAFFLYKLSSNKNVQKFFKVINLFFNSIIYPVLVFIIGFGLIEYFHQEISSVDGGMYLLVGFVIFMWLVFLPYKFIVRRILKGVLSDYYRSG